MQAPTDLTEYLQTHTRAWLIWRGDELVGWAKQKPQCPGCRAERVYRNIASTLEI